MLTYSLIRLAWLALWLVLFCFPSAISIMFSNDLSYLKRLWNKQQAELISKAF